MIPVFDLGRVVFHLDAREFEGWFRERARTPEAFWNLAQPYECGTWDTTTFHERVCRDCGIEVGQEEFAERWNAVLGPTIEGMPELLEELGGPVHALSNTNPLHAEEVVMTDPVAARFEKVLRSDHLGCMKPDPEIYRLARQAIGVEAKELVFFDDREENVAEACRQGWKAYVFEGVEEARRVLVEVGLLS